MVSVGDEKAFEIAFSVCFSFLEFEQDSMKKVDELDLQLKSKEYYSPNANSVEDFIVLSHALK